MSASDESGDRRPGNGWSSGRPGCGGGVAALLVAVALVVGLRTWWGDSMPAARRQLEQARQRSMQVPVSPPQRILLADTSVVDLVTALVPPERVAALCTQAFQWSHLATDGAAGATWRALPTFDVYATEVVLQFEPDLVICHSTNNPETTATLRDLGVPLLRLEHPSDLAGIRATLRLLGIWVGAPERAEAVVEAMDQRLGTARDRLGAVDWKVAYYSPDTSGGGWVAGQGTLAHGMLTHLGLANAADSYQGHQRISTEELIAISPDVLVVSVEAGPLEAGPLPGPLPEEQLPPWTKAPALQVVPAIRSGHLVGLHPARHSCGSHHLAAAAERIAAAISKWSATGEPR